MNPKMGWMAAALLGLVVTGCGLTSVPKNRGLALADVEMSGPTLAQGYLQPVSPVWWRQMQRLHLVDGRGHATRLPANRPVLFFAWWCPHCHTALRELQRDGGLSHLTLVSSYLNAMAPNGKPVSVRTVHDAVRVTDDSLKRLGVRVAPGRILYLMPNESAGVNMGVPTLVEPTRSGWFVMNGTPAHDAVWKTALADAQQGRE